MPKIEITDSKGLVQKTGSGIELSSKGLEGVVVSSATTLPASPDDTDISFSMPAGALVTDFGFVVKSAVGGGANGGTMSVTLGTAAGGAQLVASTEVAAANETISAGRSMSVLNGVEANVESAAFGSFVTASVLYSSTARTLYARFTQAVGDAAADGQVVAFIKYLII